MENIPTDYLFFIYFIVIGGDYSKLQHLLQYNCGSFDHYGQEELPTLLKGKENDSMGV